MLNKFSYLPPLYENKDNNNKLNQIMAAAYGMEYSEKKKSDENLCKFSTKTMIKIKIKKLQK